MTGDRVFVDTNILVYAYDRSAEKKHETARTILLDLWHSGLGVLSTQVLQEFFVVVTKKISKPLDLETTEEIIRDFLKWDVVVNDGHSVVEAIRLHKRYKYSFWDAMIIQAAKTGGASSLLSEDLSHHQVIDGIEIRNPF